MFQSFATRLPKLLWQNRMSNLDACAVQLNHKDDSARTQYQLAHKRVLARARHPGMVTAVAQSTSGTSTSRVPDLSVSAEVWFCKAVEDANPRVDSCCSVTVKSTGMLWSLEVTGRQTSGKEASRLLLATTSLQNAPGRPLPIRYARPQPASVLPAGHALGTVNVASCQGVTTTSRLCFKTAPRTSGASFPGPFGVT